MDPLGAALSENVTVSLVVTPLAVTVTVLEHAPDAIAEVPIALVPEATVTVTVPDVGNVAVDVCPVPPFAVGSTPVTCVARLTTVVAARQNPHRRMSVIQTNCGDRFHTRPAP